MSNPCDNCGCDLKVCKDCDWYNTEFIPKSVIEDIKAEIRSIQPKWYENAGKHNCIDEVIKIINKHISGKAESEGDRTTFNNLCNSCSNIGCEFQSGIVRTKCAFYMPPQVEPDNCGNYVIQDSTTKNDLDVLDKIRAEITLNAYPIVHGVNNREKGMTLYGILQVIDKYRAESEE